MIEFEPGEVATRRAIKVEGMKEAVDITLDADGYILGVEIPNLAKGLAAIAGEKSQK